MKKVIALVGIIISVLLLVACGKEDLLKRTECYIEIKTKNGETISYGVNNDTYEPSYSTTEELTNDQNTELVNALTDFIVDNIPNEEVGELFYYVESVEGEGYIVDVFYESLVDLTKDNEDFKHNKCYYFTIDADKDENQGIYRILKKSL